MQQTENLKLNLIETGDPISPIPLNENAQKLEAALASGLAAKADAVENQAAHDALEARVATLELHKFASGTYDGSTSAQDILVGFTPKAVLVQNMPAGTIALSVEGVASPPFNLIEGGFHASGKYVNGFSSRYAYIAFA